MPPTSAWMVLTSVLCVASFGWKGCLGIASAFVAVGVSAVAVIVYNSFHRAEELRKEFEEARFLPSSRGLSQLSAAHNRRKKPSFGRNEVLTGSVPLDEIITELINLTLRDYVKPWYEGLTNDEDFPAALRVLAMRIVGGKLSMSFSTAGVNLRCRNVDWVSFLTTKLVDDFASHIRLYRKAAERVSKQKGKGKCEDLESVFFDLELEMEQSVCRDLVATSDQYERAYLRDLSDVVMYLLLPAKDFACKPLRFLLREFLVNKVLVQFITSVCDSDSVNQNIMYILGDIAITPDELLTVVSWAEHRGELDSVLRQVDADVIAKRAQDTGGVDDFLGSVKTGQDLIYLFITIEGFKVSAAQMLPQGVEPEKDDLESVREAASRLFEIYLANGAGQRLGLDEAMLRKLQQSIKTMKPSESLFDQLQLKVFEMLQEDRYYPAYRRSPAYVKLLAELDLLRDRTTAMASSQSEDGLDVQSLSSSGSGDNPERAAAISSSAEPVLNAVILQTELVREGSGRGTFAVYDIFVSHESPEGEVLAAWNVYRRYSDFHEMHTLIERMFPQLGDIGFPSKRTFNNLSRDFLGRRQQQLNTYLKRLLYPDILRHNPGLRQIVGNFLNKGTFDKRKGVVPRKESSGFMSPLLSGVKTMGTAITSMPDMMVDGVFAMGKMTRSVLRGGRPEEAPMSPEGRVAAGVVGADLATDSIPLRILLLLMDEVYNLQSRNQWFRRRLVAFLQGLTKAMFGNQFNRKIVDFVNWLTCESQVVVYLTALRDYFWPKGILMGPCEPRPDDIQHRARVVTKAKMLAALPDELRLLLGSETTRRGTFMVFDALQNERLNRRLCYVLLETLLDTIFPKNRIPQICAKLHSKSPRCQAKRA